VLDMPPYARAALRRVLANGGSMRLSALVRDFGDMTGDGWFWDEQPPRSSIGELRRRALLFIGRAQRPKPTLPKRRMYKIAVVPLELRAPLSSILTDASVRREEEHALETYFASSSDLLKEAVDGVRGFFASAVLPPCFTRPQLEAFLKLATDDGFNPLLIWTNLETMLAFFESNVHELRSVSDLAGYHVSEMATDFVDQQYLQRWTIDERRDLIETVRRLYAYLHQPGVAVIDADEHEEIEDACRQLVTSKRKLRTIKRPPALGGELLLLRVNPNTGAEERFTFNHQRLIMVWFAEFHQDWRTMRLRCSELPYGDAKAALIDELIGLEPAVCELLVARVEEEDIDDAIRWYYDEPLLAVSAW
jgi:hypothetical protein